MRILPIHFEELLIVMQKKCVKFSGFPSGKINFYRNRTMTKFEKKRSLCIYYSYYEIKYLIKKEFLSSKVFVQILPHKANLVVNRRKDTSRENYTETTHLIFQKRAKAVKILIMIINMNTKTKVAITLEAACEPAATGIVIVGQVVTPPFITTTLFTLGTVVTVQLG